MIDKSCVKCEKPSNSFCTNCKLVHYCSRECQKADWKTHKTQCRPFEIKKDEKFGRYLKANRDVEADTIVVSEPPCIIGPKWNNEDEDPSSFTFFCVGCFEALKDLRTKCPNCLWPCCSEECIGLISEELHAIECAFLKAGRGPANKTSIKSVKEYFRQDALLALKILILQRRNPKKFKSLMEMEDNAENRLLTLNFKEAEDRINYLEDNFLKPLKKAEDKSNQVVLPIKDKKILHKIFGIIETNAMYINLANGNEICGLYPIGCLLEHSCLPNCSYSFDMKNGFKINVKAAREIKADEHLTTTYSHILWSTQLRQQHLKDAKYFTCSCERCKDPTELGTHFSTLRCLGSDESPCNGYQLPTNPISPNAEWACNKCPMRIKSDQVSFLTARMNDEIEKVFASSPTCEVLEELIEKLSQFLHPTHYHMFTLKHALLQLYGKHKDCPIESLSEEVLLKKLNLCNELLQIVQTLDPYAIRIPIYIGILYFEKHVALKEMIKRNNNCANIEDARKCLEEAERILKNETDTEQGKQLIQRVADALLNI
ncbi:CLUMA_CG013136, isoform A [Clunio marinus]|uniref:CLUMA_CG013136, isoform A n=1 Tax=Clunio marinus TaxID=568069 RepID=A0A1J1IJV9_9DIPT|nr:CLUMA_CG013136, isoform A [Clunio marinus]